MGERTPKLNLYKPTPGETGWGSLINENFDKIDDITPAKIGAEPAFTKNTAFNKNFGNTEGTVCQGNDPRLSEAGVLKPHADTTTRYGGSTDTLYGHAKASSTVPKQAGTANVGAEVNEFARGDHIHPAQTSVSGNAGTATKLKTARNISLSGNIKGTATAFDGTADIAIPVTDVEATKLKTARKITLSSGAVSDPIQFDGTADITIPVKTLDATKLSGNIPTGSLPIASTTTLGGIIVGDGLEIDGGGHLKVKNIYPFGRFTIFKEDKGCGKFISGNGLTEEANTLLRLNNMHLVQIIIPERIPENTIDVTYRVLCYNMHVVHGSYVTAYAKVYAVDIFTNEERLLLTSGSKTIYGEEQGTDWTVAEGTCNIYITEKIRGEVIQTAGSGTYQGTTYGSNNTTYIGNAP